MLTMQEFYDKLLSDDQQKDSYWQKIKQLVNTSLDQLTEFPDDLSWYFWNSPNEVNA
jgi:hypothetical protein